jgi:hypothetical protein
MRESIADKLGWNGARVLAFVSILLILAVCGSASTTTWTLQSVTFTDSATAVGSFTFDNSLGAPTSWNITVSGTPSADYIYNSGDGHSETCCDSTTQVGFANNDGSFSPYLFLILDGTMTPAGGTITVDTGSDTCVASGTCFVVASGEITTSAGAPEPASVLVTLSGALFVGLLLYRRRRSAAGPA